MRPTISVLAVLLLAGCGSDEQELGAGVRYFAGDAVGNHKLRTDQAGGDFSVFYGDCEARSDAGCPIPISVSNWKPCGMRVPRGKLPRTVLREVEVRYFDGPLLLTADATIEIGAVTKKLERDTVRQLRSVDGRVGVGDPPRRRNVRCPPGRL